MALFDFGWTVMVTILAALFTLLLLTAIWLLRDPRSHKVRVGFFLEREEAEEMEDVPVPPSEWPTQH